MSEPPELKCEGVPVVAAALPAYAELHCLSNFSFLRGASHPEELVAQAAALGYTALALTDRNSLAGVVRAHLAAKEHGLHLIIGAEITPVDGPPLVLLAPDRVAYGRLARLITRGRLRVRKGACELRISDIAEFAGGAGWIALVIPPDGSPAAAFGLDALVAACARYREIFGRDLYLAAALQYHVPDVERLAWLTALSQRTDVPLVATNAVHYHTPERRYLQDVLTCIREKCTLTEAGHRLFANAERHLRPRAEIARRYAAVPELLARGVAIARRCTFALDELKYEYPHELVPAGRTPLEYLAERTWRGAAARYDVTVADAPAAPTDATAAEWWRSRVAARLPPTVCELLTRELALIGELHYEHYFLTVWDLVRFARECDILCQGRGSAANSAVCYCLGVTAVDPARIDVLFERFVSKERNEPPDIDVDFEHERREEVFQYVYRKYGRERAAITAEVISYRPRSATRDVGKALGLSLDCVDQMAKSADWWQSEVLPEDALREIGLDPQNRTLRMVVKLVRQLLTFPRHLSQHVGGFVITETPLCEIVPLENGAMPNRTFIEWDKDDIDALGILKVDCLALGMLTAIHKAFDLLAAHHPPAELQTIPQTLAAIPPADEAVYDMICDADTVGVFQIESRAQMSMLPRLKPRNFYDLVIEVAIVRPGPIQGGMVHPYLRRRDGREPVWYPSPAVEAVLGKTLGVPIFQEQVMRLAVVAAGFSAGEADHLRRSMAAWRRSGQLEQFQLRLVKGMLANGYSRSFAEQIYKQIRGFGEYGFPESHAASFALLVYASAWLKHYHPAAFTGAVLNAQPMGFYAPAQLVRDAQRHGVEVRGVDVNYSRWDCTLEERHKGTEARRHAGEDGRSRTPGEFDDGIREEQRTHQDVSGSDCVATGTRAGARSVSDHGGDAAGGAIRPNCANAPFGGVDSQQHCGRLRAPEQKRLSAFSANRTRLARGAANATNPGGGSEIPGRAGTIVEPAQGSRPGLAGSAAKPPEAGDVNPACLRAFVPSCLPPALRLGFRLVQGLNAEKVAGVVAEQQAGGIRSIRQLDRRTDVSRDTLLRLAAADAFRSLGLNRREALWQILAIDDTDVPLFAELEVAEQAAELPPMPLDETVMRDYESVGLSLNAHPVQLLRAELDELHVFRAEQLQAARHGQRVSVAGLVTHRQRPGTAKGIVFMTLEDETAHANLIVRPDVWEKYRTIGRAKLALLADGRVERLGKVVHVQVTRLHDLSAKLSKLAAKSRDFH